MSARKMPTIVRTAVKDYSRQVELQQTIKEASNTLTMMEEGRFTYRTVEEGKVLASMLAKATDEPDRVILGLTELMINAVEHGNLGITYEDKSMLNDNGSWMDEVLRRLTLPEYSERYVTVGFERNERHITFTISDQGDGFDWEKYIEISPERAFDTHGRGIAMAKTISFSNIEFLGCGNKVRATVSRRDG